MTQTNQPPDPAVPDTGVGPDVMFQREAELRTQLYLEQRLEFQQDFYQQRIDEFNFNSDRMLIFAAALMGLSTLVSTYSVAISSAALALVTALLPALAAALTSFRDLYQWERQASIYEDTWLGLQRARLAMPDEDFIKPGDYALHFPELVRQTEDVLRNEAGQWGQLAGVIPADDGSAQLKPPEPEEPEEPPES